MPALLWLLSMVPPSALFLTAGIWVVRKKYGGVRHVLGVAAIVVGLLLVAITLVVLPGIPAGSSEAGIGRESVIARGRASVVLSAIDVGVLGEAI